jgi:uncharacterized RDD family membrane protein YckC
MVAQVVASADLEAAVKSVLESEQTEQLVKSVLQSPALERMLSEAMESRATIEFTDTMLRSPAFSRALKTILASPEVRSALAQQTSSLAGEAATAVRTRTMRLDDSVAHRAHRGSEALPPPGPAAVRYGGLATRGVALSVDALFANLIFLIGGALIGLVASLFGKLRPEWLVGLLVGGGWLLVVCTYFVGFWSTTGQTPGMRLMHVRVVAGAGAPPSVGRSLVRLVGLALAIIPLFAGFLPVPFDARRRAFQDYLAGTVVRYDAPLRLSSDDSG